MMTDNAYDYLKSREVSRICHFTNVRSLLHIFPDAGLLAAAFLDKEQKKVNDPVRCDGKPEYINCSIEYPNTWYLSKIQDKDPVFQDWVILFIDIGVLKDNKIMFCPCNAATDNGEHISENLRSLKTAYADTLEIKRQYDRSRQMLLCCPTDDQSEILIYKKIDTVKIKAIAVKNKDSARHIEAIFKTVCIAKFPDLIIAPDIFTNKWSKMVRYGQKPQENKYLECKNA